MFVSFRMFVEESPAEFLLEVGGYVTKLSIFSLTGPWQEVAMSRPGRTAS